MLNAVYPMPCLSQVVVDPVTQRGAEIFAHVNPSLAPLFREDFFDATTRIRRGRFYVPESPNIRQWPANQVNHHPYAQPVVGMPLHYDMEAYGPLRPERPGVKSVVFLGGVNYATAWRIIAAERLFNSETLFTLKSTNTLGTLPDIMEDALPADRRKEILAGLERVADVAHNHMPVPIVDVCREFVRVMLATWLPTVGGSPNGDLGALVTAVPADRVRHQVCRWNYQSIASTRKIGRAGEPGAARTPASRYLRRRCRAIGFARRVFAEGIAMGQIEIMFGRSL